MSFSLNRVELIGNLGADPDVRTMQSGQMVVNMRIAVSENWRDKSSGERREKTEWVPVVIFNENLAKIAEQYLRKGSKVFVEGKFQTRKWKDQSGADRYSTEVVVQGFNGLLGLLDGKPSGGGRDDDRPARSSSGGGAPTNYGSAMDDEIPFEMPWK